MKDGYSDDLSDFIRNGKLDSYELTDEELARFLEIWRWAVWTRRNQPSAPDYDVTDAVERLQQHMAQAHGVDVDYNTILLLRQELEPLMHLRVLWNLPRALGYFLRPRHLFSLARALRRARRYSRTEAVNEGGKRGYPRRVLDTTNERAPDLLQRAYWRRIGQSTLEEKRRRDTWGDAG